jgi:hypothetical protein
VTHDPLHHAAELLNACAATRHELRLVGGLAVRLHVGASARQTVDVDLVAMSEAARTSVLEHLRANGYRVGESGGWWRAVRRNEAGQRIVDVGAHPVTNPRTFDTMVLRDAPIAADVGGTEVLAIGVNDLVSLKLAAGRDQDVVDIMLLAAHCSPSLTVLARNAELDDVERLIAGTTSAARIAAAGTQFDLVAVELLGRAPTVREIEALLALLQGLKEAGL